MILFRADELRSFLWEVPLPLSSLTHDIHRALNGLFGGAIFEQSNKQLQTRLPITSIPDEVTNPVLLLQHLFRHAKENLYNAEHGCENASLQNPERAAATLKDQGNAQQESTETRLPGQPGSYSHCMCTLVTRAFGGAFAPCSKQSLASTSFMFREWTERNAENRRLEKVVKSTHNEGVPWKNRKTFGCHTAQKDDYSAHETSCHQSER